MSDIAIRHPPNRLIARGEVDDRDRVLRELQTMNNLLAARTDHEVARTELLFQRWRQRGSPIERDVFPEPDQPEQHEGITT